MSSRAAGAGVERGFNLVRLSSVAAALALVVFVALHAQPTALRLQGKVVTTAGAPIAGALVRTDAILGPAGSQFVGQRRFSVTTSAKGEWAILGITRGIWVFEASAADHAPHVVAVDVQMMWAQSTHTVTWKLPLHLRSLDELRSAGTEAAALADDMAKAVAGGRLPELTEARAFLERAWAMRLDGRWLCVAGDLALLVRDPATARGLFQKAEQSAPADACGPLGVASAAMFLNDFDTAIHAYSRARAATTDRSLQQVMSASIADLQKVAVIR